MDIDATTVAALAKLARLDLSSKELEAFAQQLPKILDYVGQLQAVTTQIVPAANQPSLNLRPDEVEVSPAASDILSAAPEHQGNLWKVQSVL